MHYHKERICKELLAFELCFLLQENKLYQIAENPDLEESILAELASKGIIDNLSLAIATADNSE